MGESVDVCVLTSLPSLNSSFAILFVMLLYPRCFVYSENVSFLTAQYNILLFAVLGDIVCDLDEYIVLYVF